MLDTGSAEGQIALFTFRIKHLTEHLKLTVKDLEPAFIGQVGRKAS